MASVSIRRIVAVLGERGTRVPAKRALVMGDAQADKHEVGGHDAGRHAAEPGQAQLRVPVRHYRTVGRRYDNSVATHSWAN